MTSVTSLCIRSQDRTQGDRTRFVIQLQYPVNIKRCHLESVILPNGFYNFENITLTVDNGVATNAVLNGCYSITSLITSLQTQWAAYTVAFNEDLMRITINDVGPFTLTIPTNEAARRLGFDELNIASVANQIIADRPPDLQRYKNIFLNISELSLGGLSSNPNSIAYTFKIPVVFDRGSYITFIENQFFAQPILENAFNQHPNEVILKIANLSVQLIGDDGYPINESQINDWSFSLRILK